MEKGAESQGAADSADDVDARTVFVRSLPFSLTDAQLEDVFSEIGPVRNCFTIKEKGSVQHRGFGFVQFAVTEDAHRAVQEKNGALLQGRKIKVEFAKRRAPLNVRHPKSDLSKPEPTTPDNEESSKPDSLKVSSKKRKSTEAETVQAKESADANLVDGKKKLKAGSTVPAAKLGDKTKEESNESKKKKELGEELQNRQLVELKKVKGKVKSINKPDQTKEEVEPVGSSKQRPARTVVVGGLTNSDMLEAVHNEAKKAGPVETVQKSMTELELNSRGLAKDGCKPRAAAIVFLSVKAARQAVALLHQKTIAGATVWARQLGGEGSKLKQLRLIVRNLPFQVTDAILRELFSPAGFVWEVTIPRKPDGLSKGFAFVGFTSKVDAEKAIKLVNGKLVAKRPVAVDWAVAKKQYEAAVAPATPSAAPDADLDEDESTASESESDEDDGDDGDSESDEEPQDSEEVRHGSAAIGKQPTSDDRKLKEKKSGHDRVSSESDEEVLPKSKKFGRQDGKQSHLETMDRVEEMDMVKKILTKVVASAPEPPSDDEEIVEAIDNELPKEKKSKSTVVEDKSPEKVSENKAHGKTAEVIVKVEGAEPAESEADGEESKLSRTVFIRNLPPDAKVPELRKLFSEFGAIKSFRLVLHPVTKKSKGNAFLEYADQEAAHAAVAAAAKNGAEDLGLVLKGRAVIVSIAVDKNSARKIAKETFHKQVEEDKRNLSLAKEGQILLGTPAAEGVSKKDMAKRQQLEHEKATKLRSPNFHVSKTRLLVHNIPKTVPEKELKKLFIEAVKSRASKQHPVIKQVKILHDEESQKSRGAAFVEFTEHQHALVALRVLNNNPGTFTSESRPIVEFAIENSLILRKRAANAVQAKGKAPQRKRTDGVDNEGENGRKLDKMQQKTRQGGKTGVVQDAGEDSAVKPDRKRKRGRDGHEARKSSKLGRGGVQDTVEQDGPQEEAANGGQREAGRKFKRGKISGADRKAAQAKRASNQATDEAKTIQSERKPKQKVQKMEKKGNKTQEDRVPERPQPVKQPNLSKGPISKERNGKNMGSRQSRLSNRDNQGEGKQRRNRRKGGDTEDQLDKLVAEYRTKYFSGVSKPSSSKGVTVASGDLRRWYE
ncbi:unnamed protein product [Calypogeia fissa]